jgi:F-type H+-transporting ATPase subunit b
MEIDWITVIAQIINFLILVYLLKRFLYHPVITAMNRRQERITAQLVEAEEREQQAEQQGRDYRDRKRELEGQRQTFLDQARQQADEERARQIEQARQEIQQMRGEWIGALKREQKEFIDTLRQQAAESVVAIAARALGDLADRDLESAIADQFLRRFAAMNDEQLGALSHAKGPVQVYTSWPPDENGAVEARLEEALRNRIRSGAEIQWARKDELICGVQLEGAGVKLEWSVNEYLNGLGEQMQTALGGVSDSHEPTSQGGSVK